MPTNYPTSVDSLARPTSTTEMDDAGFEGDVIIDNLSDAVEALETANLNRGKGWINHGSTAGTTRPLGFASVEWYGSVEPTNALNGDTWVNTA